MCAHCMSKSEGNLDAFSQVLSTLFLLHVTGCLVGLKRVRQARPAHQQAPGMMMMMMMMIVMIISMPPSLDFYVEVYFQINSLYPQ